jgi:hypothetical protein
MAEEKYEEKTKTDWKGDAEKDAAGEPVKEITKTSSGDKKEKE